MKMDKKQKSFSNNKNISVWQMFLRASVIFTVFFVLLFSVFTSAAKLSLPKKITKPTVVVGSVYKITVPKSVGDQSKYAEICRGKIKRTCTMVAKNIRGVNVSALIPTNYPIGDATIKITYKDNNKKNILIIDKAIKIISSGSNGGGGGGGGGGSSSSGGSSSFGSNNINSSPTPSGSTPAPTATPPINNKPVLVSH